MLARIAFAILAVTVVPLSAQSPPSLVVASRASVIYDGANFNVSVQYDPSKAWAGNDQLEVDVWIDTVTLRSLDVLGCENCDGTVFSVAYEPALEKSDSPTTAQPWRRAFRLGVKIKPGIDPRGYPLTLRFGAPSSPAATASAQHGQDQPKRNFTIRVGVREKGTSRWRARRRPYLA